MQRYGPKARLAAAAAMAVLIVGCEDRTRPIDAPQPASLADLEAVSELPYAEPAQVDYYEPARGYQWAERAYGLQRTFYDVPPDYGFYYDELEPYVWETADDWALYVEPWGGDYRYYYYEPGADFPYFVRDYEYGYAFGPTGLLIAVFDIGGRYLSRDVVYRLAPVAGRYYARGRDLRRASHEARRVRIDDTAWMIEGPRVSRSAGPWLRAARDDKAWRQWRERDGDRELRRFEAETRRREASAAAWRERASRREVAAVQRKDERLEAQALKARREAVRDERRNDRETAREARVQTDAPRRSTVPPKREQAGVEQRQRVQAAARDAQRAERGQAAARQQQQQQARSEPQEARQVRKQPARAEAAADRGKPAAAQERGGGKDTERDRGRGKKD